MISSDTGKIEILQEKAAILKVLSNPVRLCIVRELLERGECNVSMMQHCLELSQSTVSQHLAKLRDVGIIKGKRRSNEVYYQVINTEAGAVIKALFGKDQ